MQITKDSLLYIFFAVFLNQTVVLFGFTFATIVYIFLLKISVFLLLLIHNLLITEGILRTKTIAKWDYFSHFKIRGPKKKKRGCMTCNGYVFGSKNSKIPMKYHFNCTTNK